MLRFLPSIFIFFYAESRGTAYDDIYFFRDSSHFDIGVLGIIFRKTLKYRLLQQRVLYDEVQVVAKKLCKNETPISRYGKMGVHFQTNPSVDQIANLRSHPI